MISAEDLDFLATLVRTRAGLMLRGEKVFFIQSRLGAVARREGLASVPLLVQRLRSDVDGALAQQAVEALAAPETSFFRDKAPFDRLADEIIPELAAARSDSTVRVWCAGCSTGQEAYSIAMIADRARARAPKLQLKILGSDLSERALEKARAGLYSQFEVQRGLPIRLLIQNFERVDDNWRVGPALRNTVDWKRLNLVDDFGGLGPFDIILCRNVLNYLDAAPRAAVLQKLASALSDDGCLVLAQGEAADLPGAFEPARGGAGLHRRNPEFGRRAA